MKYCNRMESLLMSDLINVMQIPPPPSIPDHSILRGMFTTSFFKFGRQVSFEPFNDIIKDATKKKRKFLRKLVLISL